MARYVSNTLEYVQYEQNTPRSSTMLVEHSYARSGGHKYTVTNFPLKIGDKVFIRNLGFTPSGGFTESPYIIVDNGDNVNLSVNQSALFSVKQNFTIKSVDNKTQNASYKSNFEIFEYHPPTIELASPDDVELKDGMTLNISGKIFDSYVGNVITIKYKIDNVFEGVLTTIISSGTENSFNKRLVYKNGKLFDDLKEITGVLTSHTPHLVYVWAEDSIGSKTDTKTGTFTVDYSEDSPDKSPTTLIGSIPVSQDFIRVMQSSTKKLFVKLEFYDSNMSYISEFTKEVSEKDLGEVSVDLRRPVRRTFSFSLNNNNNLFDWGENNLIWIDKRVKLYIGLKLPDGSVEYAPQGVFIISEPQDSHTADGKKTVITGQDKMWLMTDRRGKFIYETTLEEGLNIGEALKLIAMKSGETLFNFDEITETVPYTLTYQAGDNIYKALEELSLLAKGIIYYDVFGYLRFKKIDLDAYDNEPIHWFYRYNDPNEKFYTGNIRKFDETELANHIIVLGGSGQTAISSFEIIVDEENPIWRGNPYSIQKIGTLTYFHNNGNPDGLLTTDDECKWRAKYELMHRLQYAERVSLSITPNYIHDAGEIIEIVDEENSVEGKYLLERFSLPINPSIMTCECVKQKKVITDWDFIE
jgi:hypothetical protein